MNPRNRRLTLALWLGALCGPAVYGLQETHATGSVDAGSQLPTTVPFRRADGLIVIKVSLGDLLPEDAVVATGLPICVISPELATKQTILSKGLAEVPTLAGPARGSLAPSQVLRIQGILQREVPFAIVDLAGHLSGKTDGAPSLWLGASCLGAFALTLDPVRSTVIFQRTLQTPPPKSFVVPFELVGGRIYVSVKPNNRKPFRALVDTASVATLLPAAAAKALNSPALASYPIKSASGKEGKVNAVGLDELVMGPVRIQNVRALYVAEGDAPEIGDDVGLIGTDVLLRFRTTIDYAKKALIFEALQIAPPVELARPTSPPAAGPESQSPAGNLRPSRKVPFTSSDE